MKVKDGRKIRDISRYAGARKHIRVPESVLDWDPARIEQELNPGTSNSRQTKVLNRALHLVIDNELSSCQREVAKCYYFDHMTLKQIADKLGITKSTACRTLSRAKNNIRNHLKYCLLFLRISAEMEDDDDD